MNQGHRMLQFILCVPLPQRQMFWCSVVTPKMSTYKSQGLAGMPPAQFPSNFGELYVLKHKLLPVFFIIKCGCFLTWPSEEVSWTSVSKSVIVVECWLKRCINIRIFKRSYISAPAHRGKPPTQFYRGTSHIYLQESMVIKSWLSSHPVMIPTSMLSILSFSL